VLDAWRAGDGQAFAAPFSDAAVFVGFDGSVMRGREQIASVHQELFDRWLKGSRLVDERTEVRFVGPDVAIVHALGGTVMRGKAEAAPERDSIQTLVAVRGDGVVVRLVSEHAHPADRRRGGVGAALARARHALAAALPRLEDRAAEDGRARRRVTWRRTGRTPPSLRSRTPRPAVPFSPAPVSELTTPRKGEPRWGRIVISVNVSLDLWTSMRPRQRENR
jgi:uncharacterized protein (TIGR02246 family)